MLKNKAREIRVGKKELVFYTDGSLGKKMDKGNMGVGQVVVDSLENRLYSIGSLKVVNWPTSTKAELIDIQIV